MFGNSKYKGLLTGQQQQDAGFNALGNAGFAMLANSGWSDMPTSLGQNLGKAGLAFNQSFDQNAGQMVQAQDIMTQRAAAKTAAQRSAQKHAAWVREQDQKKRELAAMRAKWASSGGDPNTPISEIKATFENQRAIALERQKVALKAQSSIGKLNADLRAGRINQEQYNAGIAIAKKPLVDMGADPMRDMNAKRVDELIAGYNDNAKSSMGLGQDMEVVEDLLINGMPTGGGQEMINRVKSVVKNTFGVDVDVTSSDGAKVMASLVNAHVSPLVKQLGANPTDRDLQFIVKIFPEVEGTVQGNLYVTRALRRKAARDQMIKEKANQIFSSPDYANDPAKLRVALRNMETEVMASMPLYSQEERAKLVNMARQSGGGSTENPAPQLQPLPSR